MKIDKGIVLKGINNIYTVRTGHGEIFLCRIKGKILRSSEREYNPLAPGDIVDFEITGTGEGLVTERNERKNNFVRWNMKKNLPQSLAANVDEVLCVASPDNPPFRPRFIDRVIICSGHIPVHIVMNKSDLMHALDMRFLSHIEQYKKMGFRFFLTDCMNGTGIKDLSEHIRGKTVVLVGQSGVGKSSIMNRLIPEAGQKTGAISEKYNRGRHVTNHSHLVSTGDFNLIDTPGVRELQVPVMELHTIGSYYPEIAERQQGCSYQPCLHRGEPGCEVRRAVEEGSIHHDRYESYLRVLESIEELTREY